jgi:TRAP-type C4-dicarboxylate transport system permease small subunit
MQQNHDQMKAPSGYGTKLDTVITAITRTLNIIGMVVLTAMMVLTVSDVILRTFFRHPILGGTEITEFMMIALSFGMGWCLLKEKVIRMGLLVDRLSIKKQALIMSITYTLGAVVLVMITGRTFQEAFIIHDSHAVSGILRIPTYPFYALLAFSLGILTVAAITLVIKNITKVCEK